MGRWGEIKGIAELQLVKKKSAGFPKLLKNMASLTNWVWLVRKSDFKMMFPRELFLFSLLSSNKDCLFVWESSLTLNERSSHKMSVAWGLQNLLLSNEAVQG